MQSLITAIVLAAILFAVVIDARALIADLIAFHRCLSPDFPASIRRLLWQQYAWISFPIGKALSLLLWLALAFLLTCQLARLVMAA